MFSTRIYVKDDIATREKNREKNEDESSFIPIVGFQSDNILRSRCKPDRQFCVVWFVFRVGFVTATKGEIDMNCSYFENSVVTLLPIRT